MCTAADLSLKLNNYICSLISQVLLIDADYGSRKKIVQVVMHSFICDSLMRLAMLAVYFKDVKATLSEVGWSNTLLQTEIS